MSFAPYVAIWVILVAAAGCCLIASRRPRLLDVVLLAGTVVAMALWFLFRPETDARAAAFAGRSWAVDDTAWRLSGVVLLALLAGVVYALVNPVAEQASARYLPALALAAATLPVVWSADDRTRLLSLSLFLIFWLVAGWLVRPGGRSLAYDWLGALLWPGTGLFLLWLAGIAPQARLSFTILASAIYLGAWPLGKRREFSRGAGGFSHLLGAFPVVVGAAILASGLDATSLSPAAIALATALGLLSVVMGLRWAWGQATESLAGALGIGLAGLALTASVWVGEEGLAAVVRLTVFAPAMLAVWLPDGQERPLASAGVAGVRQRRFAPQVIPAIAAYAAVGGVPLTVGFVVLSRLYDAWQFSGGYVLLVVMVVAMSLWLAAIYRGGRRVAGAGAASDRAQWRRGLAILAPLLALLSPAFDAPDGALVWIALAIPLAAGVALGQFVPGLDDLDELLRESAQVRLPAERFAPRLRSAAQAAAGAIAEALAILDGGYGLLWLLGLLLLLLWVA
jgi:hypothetical protein